MIKYFLVLFAVFFISCGSSGNDVKIEQVKEPPPEVPIAKSDANLSLPANCANGGVGCFDEQNPPLPVAAP